MLQLYKDMNVVLFFSFLFFWNVKNYMNVIDAYYSNGHQNSKIIFFSSTIKE